MDNLVEKTNEESNLDRNLTDNEEEQQDEKSKIKLTQLPVNRVKAIIKTDPDVNMINQEAVFLITTATELFINSIMKESYKNAHQCKKKTVQKHDIQSAIDSINSLAFLEGM